MTEADSQAILDHLKRWRPLLGIDDERWFERSATGEYVLFADVAAALRPLYQLLEIRLTSIETLEREVAALRAHPQATDDAVRKIGLAMWAAIDVVKEHIGGFEAWPLALKGAFSEAIINTAPPTESDLRRTRELAEKYGWEKRDV